MCVSEKVLSPIDDGATGADVILGVVSCHNLFLRNYGIGLKAAFKASELSVLKWYNIKLYAFYIG